jgi:hypothetical protein
VACSVSGSSKKSNSMMSSSRSVMSVGDSNPRRTSPWVA